MKALRGTLIEKVYYWEESILPFFHQLGLLAYSFTLPGKRTAKRVTETEHTPVSNHIL